MANTQRVIEIFLNGTDLTRQNVRSYDLHPAEKLSKNNATNIEMI